MAGATIDYRQLSVDDVEAFSDLRGEALRNCPEAFGSVEEDQSGDVRVAAYRRWLGGTIFGACDSADSIGVAGFYVASYAKSRHRGHIYTVYVREAARDNGIGDRLIKQILAFAEPRVAQVHLAVVTTAAPAIRTYKRNGFEIYGTDPNVTRVGDVAYDNYLMLRNLRPPLSST